MRDCTILVRLPLAKIEGGDVTAQRFVWRKNFNFRVAQNCGTTAYFASHNTSSQIRVFKWGEKSATLGFKDVDVATWDGGNYVSRTPDDRNWLERADPRMTGATLDDGVLWFAWGANRGGANARPQPFVQIARVRASDRTLIENVSLWDPTSAICYAALGTNANKEAGVSYSIGGGSRFPSHVVGILTGTHREGGDLHGHPRSHGRQVGRLPHGEAHAPQPEAVRRHRLYPAERRRLARRHTALQRLRSDRATCERKPESARPSRRRWLPRRCC